MRKTKNRFLHWLGYQPPGALSAKGWRLFRQEFKKNAPIRYWLTHDFKRTFVWPVKRKVNKVREYIRYRTYRKYHMVDTGLEPGYYGVEHIMLHTNFNLFKDFVECELAGSNYAWSSERVGETWFQKYMPFYRVFKPFRSKEWAMRYFEWASKLDDPSLPAHERCDHQAIAAREMRELYLWWTESVPNRKLHEAEIYSDQGLDMSILDDDFDHSAPDYVKYRNAYDLNEELRKKWMEEDDEMLARLIKIRRSLWT
jgi:hypothetical protein